MPEHARAHSCLPAAMAAVVASLLILFTLPPVLWFAYPVILIIAMFAASLVGVPLYLLARRADRVNGWTAALAGFLAGIAPLTLFVGNPFAMRWAMFATAALGIGGAGTGLLFLLMLHWPIAARARRMRLATGAVGLIAAAYAVYWAGQDRSCHNALRDGRTAAVSAATFVVELPAGQGPQVVDEAVRFAQANGWSIQRGIEGKPEFDTTHANICHEPGIAIEVYPVDASDGINLSIYSERKDADWQAPLAALHRRLAARWPGRIRYYVEGKLTDRSPDWTTGPKISPAPSSAAR